MRQPRRRRPIVERLAREIKQATAHPKFIAALAPLGMQIVASSPDEMLAGDAPDSEKWGKVIAETGTTINHSDRRRSSQGIMMAPPLAAIDCPVM